MDSTERPRSRPARRRLRAVAGAGLVLTTLAVAGAATLGLGGRGADQAVPRRTGPAATATVTRQTLVKTVTLAGELGYGPAAPLTSTATGTVTWLPDVGTTVRRGEALLRADELPVVLLYGFLPMYRPLTTGVQGSDVRQFERNLAALGYRGFTVDEEFSASTSDAVKRWQKDLEVPETGTVDRDRVIYTPGPVRIAQRLARVGASATGDVLSYTGNTRMVTVSAAAGEAAWAAKGAKVTVTLPTGTSVAGQVTAIGPPTPAASGGQTPPDPEHPGTGAAAVQVTIAIPDQKALGGLAGASVDVRYVAQERKKVLTVPVTALLALTEGGYGLEVTDPGGTRIVAVEVGLFAEGRVEVQGDGLTEGLSVGVPG
ncbi:Multidrug efflux pump subunit AcrA (membrane-fusion protein) [Micromonospora rhizosphaerae]|uniref:Multidrug efflux pump subunit AcrA (Membrane-fusion protein) n=1 Tax=Micromonospora rhizosphaerae TaxID=568872 RepID=A0A1C6RGK0_9ACTN|nr:peptidoglycan-binding protein [Micromonospora rhizosphaerae]SCL16114.1 Multidrug efflux pump subunit AcrA (membrane-fusion protein) [Micromonospora rhizosphaerae]